MGEGGERERSGFAATASSLLTPPPALTLSDSPDGRTRGGVVGCHGGYDDEETSTLALTADPQHGKDASDGWWRGPTGNQARMLRRTR